MLKKTQSKLSDSIEAEISSHIEVARLTLEQVSEITEICLVISSTLKSNGTIYLCGNGGSAADCQHIAAELVGRFEIDGNAIKAIALTTDTSIMTSIANDFDYSYVFTRQLEAFLRPNDILIALSTSGNSPNVKLALQYAKQKKCITVSLLGGDGGSALAESDYSIVIQSNVTSRIQEMHIMLGHIICRFLETQFRHD